MLFPMFMDSDMSIGCRYVSKCPLHLKSILNLRIQQNIQSLLCRFSYIDSVYKVQGHFMLGIEVQHIVHGKFELQKTWCISS